MTRFPVADVAVLGAGPAATACARGLRRLGYSVVLVGHSRSTAIEGLSKRTRSMVAQAGLGAAAAAIGALGQRAGTWAGTTVLGQEYVIERAVFDNALQIDAAAGGVAVRADWVKAVERRDERWRVKTSVGEVDCQLVVDARGRRARRAQRRGPSLFAISQRFRIPAPGTVRTAVHPFAHGWCWLAEDGRGWSWVQIVEATHEPLARSDLSRRVSIAIAATPALADRLAHAVPVAEPQVRAAVARFSAPAQAPGYLRAGDASVAMDPLSGHGIHEALMSATVAIAAANTYLSGGEWAPVERFMNERAAEVWARTTAAAAHFYRTQADHTPTSFWTRTAAAYEAIAAAAADRESSPARLESRPVLNGDRIEVRRVVVTGERPRGVWQFESLELARLMELIEAEPGVDISQASAKLSHEPAVVAGAARWLATQGLITGSRLLAEAGSPNRGG